MKKSNKPDTIDCLGMGIIPYDLLFSIDRYPLPGMKIDACDFFMQGGGPVPNVAIGLSRLGFKTALIAWSLYIALISAYETIINHHFGKHSSRICFKAKK